MDILTKGEKDDLNLVAILASVKRALAGMGIRPKKIDVRFSGKVAEQRVLDVFIHESDMPGCVLSNHLSDELLRDTTGLGAMVAAMYFEEAKSLWLYASVGVSTDGRVEWNGNTHRTLMSVELYEGIKHRRQYEAETETCQATFNNMDGTIQFHDLTLRMVGYLNDKTVIVERVD